MTSETVALQDGEKTVKDENENVYKLGSKEDRKKLKASKIQQKRHQQHMERRKRLIGEGVPEDKVDEAIAKQDYNSLPPEKKIARIEKVVQSAFQSLAQEMNNLRHNDTVLADSLDVNFRAFAKMLIKLGISLEEQKTIVEETQKEVNEDRRKRVEQHRASVEQKAAESALHSAENLNIAPTEPQEDVSVPEGATEFGD